jgi:hypothetical protein
MEVGANLCKELLIVLALCPLVFSGDGYHDEE